MIRNCLGYVLAIGILACIAPHAGATHLMGGNLAYEYLGDTDGDGDFNYRITFVTYIDCASPFLDTVPPLTGFPEPDLTIALYEGSLTPGPNLPLTTSLFMNLSNWTLVTPPMPSGCTVTTSCILEAVYIEEVDLPVSFNGYHIYYERCCRNSATTNLDLTVPCDQGMAFHAYISPTLLNNSSPVFADVPVPFICIGDTTGIINTAFDPDGDLMIFSFEDPYEGEYTGDGGGGCPGPDLGGFFPDPINWPFPIVTWQAGGYSKIAPFGPSGYAFINAFTGYSEYVSTIAGNYVVAVEIKEYRGGSLIGITRRDMQLLAVTCPANPAPTLTNATDGTIISAGEVNYVIEEGDSLCSDLTFTDINGDSLTLTASGLIFDPGVTNPAATINQPVTGAGTVTTQFCWNTDCGQGQALPYLFTVKVTDNGCPPKTTPVVFTVEVVPFDGPDSISGPNPVCSGETGVVYSVTNIPGANFNWTVSSGTITSGNGTNSITVDWGNGPVGQVSVTTTSQYGCTEGPLNLPVSIITFPADAGPDTFICLGDSVQIGGSPTTDPGYNITWSPGGSLSNPVAANPWATPTFPTTYVVSVDDGFGCVVRDTVEVGIGNPLVNAGINTIICPGDSTQLNATGGVDYIWTPSATLSNDTIPDPWAGPSAVTVYYVTVTDTAGCAGTDSVIVDVATIITADAGPDTSVCQGESVVIGGNPTGPPGSTFNWGPSTYLDDSTLANRTSTPVTGITYTVSVTDSIGCVYIDSMTVTIDSLPPADAGLDTTICNGDCAQLTASGGTGYAWSPTTGLSNPNIFNPLACPTATTTYIVTVTDSIGCQNTDTVVVTVLPTPNANAGIDTSFCEGDSIQLNASGGISYQWAPSSSLSNDTISNPWASPTSTTVYSVTVTDINGCRDSDVVVITIDTLPMVIASSDTSICLGDCAQLSVTGADTYIWTPSASLNNDTIANPIACPGITTTYVVTGTATGLQNAVVNGNFESGATGFTSDYSVGIPFPGNYIVGPNPTVFNGAYSGSDHTTGSGNFMIVDGSTTPGDNVWCQVVSVTPNTNYTFSAWVNNLIRPTSNFTDPTLQFYIDGSPLCGAVTLPEIPDVWVQITCVWNSGPSTSVTLCVQSLTNTGGGNDFGIDDIALIGPAIGTGCSNTDSVTVTVNPIPVADAGNDTIICLVDTLQFSGSGGGSYHWQFGDGDTANVQNPTHIYGAPAVYTAVLTVTDSIGCQDQDTMLVTVNTTPNVDAGPDLWVCPGDSAQLNVTGASTYTWSPGITLNDSTVFNPLAGPLDTTTYIVTGTTLNGCVNTDTMTVFVNGNVPTEAGNDTAICLGDSARLGGTPTSLYATTYTWTPNTGLDNDTVANPMAAPATTTTYYLTTTNDTCTGLDSITVTVNTLPPANAGNDVDICIGDSTQLNATGGISFVWSPPTWLSNDTIADPWAGPPDTTSYLVSVTDTNGCVNTDTVVVNVNPLPVVDAGIDTSICFADSAQLNATGGISFAWTPSGSLSNDTIANPMASPAITTTYYVAVTDSNGCVNIDSVVVTVNPPPNVDAGIDDEICIGDSTRLNATGGTSYAWSPATNLSDTAIANPWASPTSSLIYFVTVTDSNGCRNFDSVTVTVLPLPLINAGNDTAICFGSCASLNATGGVSYYWFPATGLSDSTISNPTACPDSTTTYYVVGSTKRELITNGDFEAGNTGFTSDHTFFTPPQPPAITNGEYSIVSNALDASPGWTGTDHTSGNGNFFVASFNIPGSLNIWCQTVAVDPNTDYYFTFWAMAPIIGTLSDQIGININSTLISTETLPGMAGVWQQYTIPWNSGTNTSAVICISASWVFEAGSAAGLDDISFSPQQVTGCSNIDSITVTVNPLPVVDAGVDTIITCKNSPEVIGGSPTCPSCLAGSGYLWSPASTLNNPTLENPTAATDVTTTYVVTVTDHNGCVNTDSSTVSVFSIDVVTDTSTCEEDSIALIITPVSGVPIYTYAWSPSDGLSDTTIANPNSAPLSSIVYSVTVTDGNNCVETDSIFVTVNINPESAFDFVLFPSCEGVLAEFENLSINADSYLWIFGDGETSTEEHTSHVFPYLQEMNPILIAITSFFCDDTSSVSDNILGFEDYFDLKPPNVFTPNGDGINDFFEVEFENKLQECTDLNIFNRWGELLFTSSGNTHYWDGRTFAGKEVPEGVYYYILDIRGILFKGSFTLLR